MLLGQGARALLLGRALGLLGKGRSAMGLESFDGYQIVRTLKRVRNSPSDRLVGCCTAHGRESERLQGRKGARGGCWLQATQATRSR